MDMKTAEKCRKMPYAVAGYFLSIVFRTIMYLALKADWSYEDRRGLLFVKVICTRWTRKLYYDE